MKASRSDYSGLAFDAEVPPGSLFIEQEEWRHDKYKPKIRIFSPFLTYSESSPASSLPSICLSSQSLVNPDLSQRNTAL